MTRDDPAAFAPPPAFGPFRVLHQIGIGALGPVFRTYEPTRDRLVAVKLFRLDITPEQAQSLADELARACDGGLFHPSIVEPIAAGVEGTAAYRAEEYVAAESLDVAIRHYAPASLDTALPFITQLAGAIDFARTAGVGHGGLHLRDIFVTPDEARASGFGIVESLERVGIRAPVRRPYSAPERIAGEAWSTPADVFSLAAIAYELLTGRRPSGTGTHIGALAGDNFGGHAAAVHAVLARAMDDDPARRYPTALAFASALETAAHRAAAPDAVPAVATTSVVAELAPPVGSLAEGEAAFHPEEIESQAQPAPQIERAIPVPAPIEVVPAPFEEEPAAAEVAAPVMQAIEDVDADVLSSTAIRLGQPIEKDAPMLFDTEESADEPVDDEPPLRPQAASPRWRYEPEHEAPSSESFETFTEPERPRVAMLPVAFGVILGLLIGFAGGYAVGGRDNTGQPQSAAAPVAPAPVPSPQASPPPQRSGRAWSEQAIAQPSAPAGSAGRAGTPSTAPPPVPGDAPAGKAPPAPRSTRATLTVESTPKNAAVTVNGKWRGRTPLTIDDLAFGTHTLRIVQPGYAVARQVVTLTKSEPARTLTFKLQRPGTAAATSPQTPAPPTRDRFSGSLFVASNPPGARVFIDGRPFGTAPARIPEVSIGSHVVRLELPDHRIWSTSTRVAAGQETRVTGSLERIQ